MSFYCVFFILFRYLLWPLRESETGIEEMCYKVIIKKSLKYRSARPFNGFLTFHRKRREFLASLTHISDRREYFCIFVFAENSNSSLCVLAHEAAHLSAQWTMFLMHFQVQNVRYSRNVSYCATFPSLRSSLA